MGVLSDSNISISKDKKIKIQELNKNDTILSVKNKEGLLNYKYYGRSIPQYAQEPAGKSKAFKLTELSSPAFLE